MAVYKLSPGDIKRRRMEMLRREAELRNMSSAEKKHAKRMAAAEETGKGEEHGLDKKPKKSRFLLWLIIIAIVGVYIYFKYIK